MVPEAEVVVVLGDFFSTGSWWMVMAEWSGHGDLGAADAAHGEEAAVDVVVGGGGDFVVVGGDELDAGVVEGEGGVAVVGEDDADGDEAVLDVGEAEEVAVFGVVAGFGGYGDLSLGWVSKAAYWVAGLAGGAFFFSAWRGYREEAGGYQSAGIFGIFGNGGTSWPS